MIGSAVISDDGVYRYVLRREWQPEMCDVATDDEALFVMLNPSTADALQDDPTIRRCVGFARDQGFSRLSVVNLFALRAKDPSEIYDVTADPVGPDNDRWIQAEVARARLIVCAWGVHGRHLERDRHVLDLIRMPPNAKPPYALGTNRDGSPKHPLYVRGDTLPVPFLGRP